MIRFTGEQFRIVIHISTHHPDTSGIITPFKVAAAIQKQSGPSPQEPVESLHDKIEGDGVKVETPKSARSALKGKWFTTTQGGNLVATTDSLIEDDDEARSEGHRRRTAMLLESFKKSHFHVRIGRKGDGTKQQDMTGRSEQLGLSDEEGSDRENIMTSHGCKAVVMEDGEFQPATAGGVARAATSCWSLGNGDVVVSSLRWPSSVSTK